jgi:hypothetical protein
MIATMSMMPRPYELLDERAAKFYIDLSRNGIPLDQEAMVRIREEQERFAQALIVEIQTREGFRPDPFDAYDYDGIARSYAIELPRTGRGKFINSDEKTILRLCGHIPTLVKMTQARKALRFVAVLTNLLQRMEGGRIYPTYKLDPELGRVHAGGDANPMNWELFLQKLVRLPDHQIVVAAYERMELKIIAAMSGDRQFQQDLRSGIHIYQIIARSMFNTEWANRTQLEMAKAVTFSTIYGQSHKSLAVELRTSEDHARELANRWGSRYPKAVVFLRDLAEQGRSTGKAVSYHGREKEIPETDDLDYQIRLAANSPVQNTGGDLAKTGFCNLYEDPDREKMGGQILTTVHDSIISAWPMSVPTEQIIKIHETDLVGRNDPHFDLSILINIGPSWGDVQMPVGSPSVRG